MRSFAEEGRALLRDKPHQAHGSLFVGSALVAFYVFRLVFVDVPACGTREYGSLFVGSALVAFYVFRLVRCRRWERRRQAWIASLDDATWRAWLENIETRKTSDRRVLS